MFIELLSSSTGNTILFNLLQISSIAPDQNKTGSVAINMTNGDFFYVVGDYDAIRNQIWSACK